RETLVVEMMPPEGDHKGPFKGRHLVMLPREPLRPRRGGGWVVRGGDACVALVLLLQVPSPLLPGRRKRPRPTSTPLPLSGGGILWLRLGGPFVPVGAGVVDGVGGDACVALVPRCSPPSRATQASPPHNHTTPAPTNVT